jgi:hypothetical protein
VLVRGGCTTGRPLTDEAELRAFFPNLSEADWANIERKLGVIGWDSYIANATYHRIVERRLKPLQGYLDLTHAQLEKIVKWLPQVLHFNHNSLVTEKLEPLQEHLQLTHAELKQIVRKLPSVMTYDLFNLVTEKLHPLQAHLALNDAELKKIVLKLPSVMGYAHTSVLEKLRLQQECLGMTDVEFRNAVLVDVSALSAGYIEEKWALMMSEFAEEEGDRKLQALRSLGPRGLGVGLPRLQRRLADLKEALGSAPKASVWFKSLVKNTDAQWASRRQNLLLNPESGNRDIPSSHSS